MNAVEVDTISKSYDELKAVDGVSFTIPEGQMYGLLGPNGAGKTSIMRMIMNILIPDSGSIALWGTPFQEQHKNRIGYLPEERGLYPKMRLVDHLQFLGELKGLSAHRAREIAMQWLEKFQLADRAHEKILELSKGLQQKAQFIATILHSPDLLILDEPFSGLDPVNTKFLKDILLELKQGGVTIILSTHLMEQAEKLCEGICLINRGKVILQGTMSEIKQRYSHNAVIVEYSGEGNFISTLPMVKSVNDYGNYMEIRLREDAVPAQLFRALADASIEVRRFEAAETSLNDIFIDLVGEDNHE